MNHFIAFLTLAVQDFIIVMGMLFMFSCLVVFILSLYLVRKLNPKLDPIFKSSLWYTGFAPHISHRLVRSRIYSGWVAQRWLFLRYHPSKAHLDLKKIFGPKVHLLCCIQTFFSWFGMLALIIISIKAYLLGKL